ncbi:MAG: hypothetical protein K1000chlam2_01826 [Chlamydiae bacterium]|nr:hypothetical protein [Chlamydiota bacterium]
MEINIEIYETSFGKRPFDTWFEDIQEKHTRAKILTRLDRLKLGNFGDYNPCLLPHFSSMLPAVLIYYASLITKVPTPWLLRETCI